jgi:tetratricopeptide (TPR) repeat protein
MPRFPEPLRLLPLVLCLALLPARSAFAQQFQDPSMLDPEEMAVPSEIEEEDPPPDDEPAPDDEERPRGKKGRDKGRKGEDKDKDKENPKASGKPDGSKPGTPPPPAAPPPPVRTPPPPILSPRVTDANLLAVWKRWKDAQASLDTAGAAAAQKELVTLRAEVGAMDLESLSMGFLRVAEARRQAKDEASAMQLTELAVQLSPNLPYARLTLAEAWLRRSPGAVGQYLGEVKGALGTLLRDPRYRRPALADLGTAGLLAVLATAVVGVGVLFARRVRYFFHDFHHFFPRVTARWQSGALAVLLLTTPVVFRLGLVQVLLVLLAVVALYLSVVERVVGVVLVALVALVPLAAGQLAQSTAFAGTVAEDVYVLERGGIAAEEVAARVRERFAQQSAGFAELFALGRFEARRGQLEEAITHYKAASALRSGHAALLVNLGNALLASGDDSGAGQLYTQAMQADPSSPAPPFNLAEVYRRRAKVAPDDEVGAENQRASDALAAAQRLEPSLLMWERPKDERLLMNLLLMSPPLPMEDLPAAELEELGKRVEEQLARGLLGGSGALSMLLALAGAGLAFLWGFAGGTLKASGSCERCGRSVCRRCDKDLPAGGKMCAQCVNAFSRKGLVPPQMRARKQLEVERHRRWASRASYVLGALISGAGHLFAGLPVRGALYAFLFLFAVAGVFVRNGVVRAPYGEVPLYLKLIPLLLLLIPLHLLTLRGLFRRQQE